MDYGPPRYGPWHEWFAWRPVKTDWHGWKWLKTLERRMWRGGGFDGWDYQPREDVTDNL